MQRLHGGSSDDSPGLQELFQMIQQETEMEVVTSLQCQMSKADIRPKLTTVHSCSQSCPPSIIWHL